MNKKAKVFNINTFNFYRRHVKPKDLDKTFIGLIENEEKKIDMEKKLEEKEENNTENIKIDNYESRNNNNSETKNSKSSKHINLKLIYPTISIERIKKIRDLFLEFDEDKSRTFDQNELYLMFNMNKIPIKIDEVKYLFGFDNHKKGLSFNEFIQLTVNEHFSIKFKKLIMEKIRHRTKEGDICPNDFNDMLSHLCEFTKLSRDLKKRAKEGRKKVISENVKNKRLALQKKSILRVSLTSEIMRNLVEKKTKEKIYDFNKEKDIKEIREKPNIIQKETEFKNFSEISNKKLLRFNKYLEQSNIKEKLLQRKAKLIKSLDIINSNNSDIAKNYISYYPMDNVFKKAKTDLIVSFSFKKKNKNISYPKINDAESNISIYDKNKLKNTFFNYQSFKKTRLNKKGFHYHSNCFSRKSENKSKQDTLKEKEFASILAQIRLNDIDLPKMNNKDGYIEKTFVNTGLLSDLSVYT